MPSATFNGLRLISTGNSGPVLAQAIELEPRTHRPDFGIREEAAAVVRVSVAETFGDEAFDRLAEKFVGRVTEQAPCLPVEHDDSTTAVDNHHCVWSGFQQPPQVGLDSRIPVLGRCLVLPTASSAGEAS